MPSLSGVWFGFDQRLLVAMVFLPALVVITLGVPMAGTKLYLFGISVDQQFLTEYLTRFTDSAGLSDMTHTGMPSFYPPGWFWIGGRAAPCANGLRPCIWDSGTRR